MRPLHASTKCKYTHLLIGQPDTCAIVQCALKYRRTRINHLTELAFIWYYVIKHSRNVAQEIDLFFVFCRTLCNKLFICNGHFDSPIKNARCAHLRWISRRLTRPGKWQRASGILCLAVCFYRYIQSYFHKYVSLVCRSAFHFHLLRLQKKHQILRFAHKNMRPYNEKIRSDSIFVYCRKLFHSVKNRNRSHAN